MEERNENKKSLKKKIVVGAAFALLLGLVGVTTANTYAKYTDSKDVATTTATVAKWGYVLNADASKLWGTDYAFETDASKVTDNGVTVDSSDSNNVVAPGTTGFVTLSVDGSTEVLSSLTIDATITDISLTPDGGSAYNPLVWTLSGTAKVGDNDLLSGKTLTGTGAEMASLLDGLSQTRITPNTKVDIDLILTWAWAFSNGHDAEDTILGTFANGTSVAGYTAVTTTSLALKASVEQLAQ